MYVYLYIYIYIYMYRERYITMKPNNIAQPGDDVAQDEGGDPPGGRRERGVHGHLAEHYLHIETYRYIYIYTYMDI